MLVYPGEGGGKERSAETGQEGLEDVPDYQESLRKYALGLGEQEANSQSSHKGNDNNSNERKPKEHRLDKKGRLPDGNPQDYRLGPPSAGMPNGYPYPMPHYHPGHSHPTQGERKNGAGYPADGYYPPSPYRMPYPPYTNMLKPGNGHKLLKI